MECFKCKTQIDNDSHYCDQCGIEIKICSECKQPGKGKMCTKCGKPMVSASQITSQTKPDATINIQNPTIASSVQSDPGMMVGKTIRPDSNNDSQNNLAPKKLTLINNAVNLNLEGIDGAIVGRRNSPYANNLAQFGQISGTHARFDYDPNKGWIVTDLNSTNGTKYNKVKIAANVPTLLADKSYLQFANIEFYVEIK